MPALSATRSSTPSTCDRLRERLVEPLDQPVRGVARPVEAARPRSAKWSAPMRATVSCSRAASRRRAPIVRSRSSPALRPKRLVHHAEALDVEEHRGGEALLAPRGVQRLRHAVGEQAAVRQVGERVVVGEVVHRRLLREVVQREGDVARELVQQAHLLLVEEVAHARIEEQHADRLARSTISGSATNEPAVARRSRSSAWRAGLAARSSSRSGLPSPARASEAHAPVCGRGARSAARRKPPFSTAMRQASSSSAWRSSARTISALIAESIASVRFSRSIALLLRLERAGLLEELVDHQPQVARDRGRRCRVRRTRPARSRRALRSPRRRMASLSEGLTSTRATPSAWASCFASWPPK